MIKEKREVTPEDMIEYYTSVLKYTKKESHRKYINLMIGYHSGKNPYPSIQVCETLK